MRSQVWPLQMRSMHQLGANRLCKVTSASDSPQAQTQHPLVFLGRKAKSFVNGPRHILSLTGGKGPQPMQNQIFPVSTFMHPTSLVFFHH